MGFRQKHGTLDALARFIRRKPLGAVGAAVFAIFLICGLSADLIAPYGVNEINPISRLKPPSWEHLFGTDNLGRDMFSRILYGARLSMIIGFCTAALATIVSVLIGLAAGYAGGTVDALIQRFVDAWMSFPDLVILIVVVAVLGPGIWQVIMILGLLYGITGSRIIRAAVLTVRQNTYVTATVSIGSRTPRVLLVHILPNVMAPVIVLFTTRVGAVILAESSLSFLGLGVPPPAPSWGGMLSGSGRSFMYMAPWLAFVPGLAITIVVYSINIFGDALRDVLDPRMRGS